MQPEIILYTKDYCPYCQRAKALLTAKGLTYTEFEVADNPEKFAEMMQRSNGGRTVPQIFIGDIPIGGAMDMFALDEAGKLDPLLKLQPAT
ncbi:MAG: glutaredoxin 3 [Hellea sp.]